MPVYRERLELGNRRDDLHILDFCTHSRDVRLNQRSLLSTSACMTFGTKNILHLPEEFKKRAFREGQVYDGYYIKTINGPYDYCYKIWTRRQWPFAPLNALVPHPDEFVEAVVIDKNGSYFGLGCGGNMAFCTEEHFVKSGIDPASIILPMVGIKVQLRKMNIKRPPQIPYAAFEVMSLIRVISRKQVEEKNSFPLSVIAEENCVTRTTTRSNVSSAADDAFLKRSNGAEASNNIHQHPVRNQTSDTNGVLQKSHTETANLNTNGHSNSQNLKANVNLGGNRSDYTSCGDIGNSSKPDITSFMKTFSENGLLPGNKLSTSISPEDVAISTSPLSCIIAGTDLSLQNARHELVKDYICTNETNSERGGQQLKPEVLLGESTKECSGIGTKKNSPDAERELERKRSSGNSLVSQDNSLILETPKLLVTDEDASKSHQCVDSSESHQCVDSFESLQCVDSSESHQCVDSSESHQCVDSSQSHQCVDSSESHQCADSSESHQCVDSSESHQCVDSSNTIDTQCSIAIDEDAVVQRNSRKSKRQLEEHILALISNLERSGLQISDTIKDNSVPIESKPHLYEQNQSYNPSNPVKEVMENVDISLSVNEHQSYYTDRNSSDNNDVCNRSELPHSSPLDDMPDMGGKLHLSNDILDAIWKRSRLPIPDPSLASVSSDPSVGHTIENTGEELHNESRQLCKDDAKEVSLLPDEHNSTGSCSETISHCLENPISKEIKGSLSRESLIVDNIEKVAEHIAEEVLKSSQFAQTLGTSNNFEDFNNIAESVSLAEPSSHSNFDSRSQSDLESSTLTPEHNTEKEVSVIPTEITTDVPNLPLSDQSYVCLIPTTASPTSDPVDPNIAEDSLVKDDQENCDIDDTVAVPKYETETADKVENATVPNISIEVTPPKSFGDSQDSEYFTLATPPESPETQSTECDLASTPPESPADHLEVDYSRI